MYIVNGNIQPDQYVNGNTEVVNCNARCKVGSCFSLVPSSPKTLVNRSHSGLPHQNTPTLDGSSGLVAWPSSKACTAVQKLTDAGLCKGDVTVRCM